MGSTYSTPWGFMSRDGLSFACLLAVLCVWFIYGFLKPYITYNDPKSTAVQRRNAGLQVCLLGLGLPAIIIGVITWLTSGNANSPATGGNKPGNTGGAPNLPSNAAGASNELAPKINAPAAVNVKAPNAAPAA